MVDIARREQWSMTSEVLAAIYNTIRDPKKRPRPFTGSMFNPYAEKARPTTTISVKEWMKRSGGKFRKA